MRQGTCGSLGTGPNQIHPVVDRTPDTATRLRPLLAHTAQQPPRFTAAPRDRLGFRPASVTCSKRRVASSVWN